MRDGNEERCKHCGIPKAGRELTSLGTFANEILLDSQACRGRKRSAAVEKKKWKTRFWVGGAVSPEGKSTAVLTRLNVAGPHSILYCIRIHIFASEIVESIAYYTMNVSKSKTSSPVAPEKGSFPLDHFSECKVEMTDYMDCLKQNSFLARACVSLQKDYFKCRMDKYVLNRGNGTPEFPKYEFAPSVSQYRFTNDLRRCWPFIAHILTLLLTQGPDGVRPRFVGRH